MNRQDLLDIMELVDALQYKVRKDATPNYLAAIGGLEMLRSELYSLSEGTSKRCQLENCMVCKQIQNIKEKLQ